MQIVGCEIEVQSILIDRELKSQPTVRRELVGRLFCSVQVAGSNLKSLRLRVFALKKFLGVG